MSISLNNVNSEVVRAHKRIDEFSESVPGVPDYSTLKQDKLPFTAPYNCICFVEGLTGRTWHWVKVNNLEVYKIYEDYNGYCNITVIVNKDDEITGSTDFDIKYAKM